MIRALALSACALALSACGGGGAAQKPGKPALPKSTVQAEALAGPFADVAAFCAHLGDPACEANDQILMRMDQHKDPIKLRSGQTVKTEVVVSRNREAQRAHLLFHIDGQLWAPAPAFGYDPSGGKRLSAMVMRFKQDDDAATTGDDQFEAAVTATIERSAGGQADTEEYNLHCRVGPKPACLRVTTSLALQDGLDTLNLVSGATGLGILRQRGQAISISQMGQLQFGDKYDAAAGARLLPEGEYRIVYP